MRLKTFSAQRQSHQRRRDLLPRGQRHIGFAIAQPGAELTCETKDAIGFTGHGGNDDNRLFALVGRRLDQLGSMADSLRRTDRCAPKFRHDSRHCGGPSLLRPDKWLR